MFKLAACVFLGSGLGGVARYLTSVWMGKYLDANTVVGIFPWPTLAVNVAGCLLIGLVYGWVDGGTVHLSEEAKTFLTAGICGGLTTFSTFTHENYLLFQSHNFGVVLVYAAVSLLLGFAAAWVGHQLA